jgi:hypothetical protein
LAPFVFHGFHPRLLRSLTPYQGSGIENIK